AKATKAAFDFCAPEGLAVAGESHSPALLFLTPTTPPPRARLVRIVGRVPSEDGLDEEEELEEESESFFGGVAGVTIVTVIKPVPKPLFMPVPLLMPLLGLELELALEEANADRDVLAGSGIDTLGVKLGREEEAVEEEEDPRRRGMIGKGPPALFWSLSLRLVSILRDEEGEWVVMVAII
ncbi:hypothetical protein CVT26_013834, partial [Gymnopilus dilepis]